MLQHLKPILPRVTMQILGLCLLAAGLAAAVIAPIEIHAFTLFSEGGKHHFAGFGFGSLMFANIAVQVAAYYVVALVGIPLGYGLLRLRRWARVLLVTLLYDWLALGLPLSVIAFLMLVTSKGSSSWSLPLVGLGFVLVYPGIPLLLIWWAGSRQVRVAFESQVLVDSRSEASSDAERTTPEGQFASEDANSAAAGSAAPGVPPAERARQADLVLAGLLALFAVLMHIPMLFNGLFPLFGAFLTGVDGMVALGLSALLLAILAWGMGSRRRWAWWGAVAYFVLLLASTIITLSSVSFLQMIGQLRVAGLEMEMLSKMPLRSVHLLLFSAVPLVTTLVLLGASAPFRATRG